MPRRESERHRLRLAGFHAGEDRRRLGLLHPLEHVEQDREIELLEDARGLFRLHRLVYLDQALKLGVVLLVFLLERVVDRPFHLLELGDLGVDALFRRLQQRLVAGGFGGAAQQPVGGGWEGGDAPGRDGGGDGLVLGDGAARLLERPFAGDAAARARIRRVGDGRRRRFGVVAPRADRTFETIGEAAAEIDDVREIGLQSLALLDSLLELLADPFRRLLQRGDPRLGTLRGNVETADQCLELPLVVAQRTKPPAEQDGIGDRGDQKPGHDDIQDNVHVHRIPLTRSTFSPMRTAMLPPLRPIRPENIGTSPHSSAMSDCGVALSGMRVPTSQLMTSRSEYSNVSSTACSGTLVFHSSPARCASQIESRPNFSPMNIWRRSSRTGSRVAYGSSSSSRPPRSSMSTRMRASTAALAGRAMVAERGLVSSRSKRTLTGLQGSKAEERSESTTATMRSTRLRSIVV